MGTLHNHLKPLVCVVAAVLLAAVSFGAMSARKFPIKWRVTLSSLAGLQEGTAVLEIIEAPPSSRGRSCLGVENARQHLVFVLSKDKISDEIRIGQSAVASIADDRVIIDFTAGTCDAYYLFEGKLTLSGASGDVIMRDLSGSQTVGHFLAQLAR